MNAPATRLSIAYFVYFCAIGVYTPFWSPYLELRGFNAVEIGLLLGVAAGVRAIGPVVFGWLADSSGRPTAMLRLAALLSLLSFAILPLLSSLGGFIWLMILFSFGWNSIAPSLDSHTLEHLGPSSARYGRVRLWGSLGFIVMSWLGGIAFQAAGYDYVPTIMLGFIVLTLVATMSITHAALPMAPAAKGEFKEALRSRSVWVALLVAALIAISFGPYYTFYSIYLETFGYARSTIGFLWALGVFAEIAVFALGGSVLARCSIRTLYVVAAAGTAVRWSLIALFPEYLAVLALAQLLHSLGFAVLHFAIVLTARRSFSAAASGRGQAIFSSAGYGLGGMLGSLLGGMSWAALSPRSTYLGAMGVAATAALAAFVGMRRTALDRGE